MEAWTRIIAVELERNGRILDNLLMDWLQVWEKENSKLIPRFVLLFVCYEIKVWNWHLLKYEEGGGRGFCVVKGRSGFWFCELLTLKCLPDKELCFKWEVGYTSPEFRGVVQTGKINLGVFVSKRHWKQWDWWARITRSVSVGRGRRHARLRPGLLRIRQNSEIKKTKSSQKRWGGRKSENWWMGTKSSVLRNGGVIDSVRMLWLLDGLRTKDWTLDYFLTYKRIVTLRILLLRNGGLTEEDSRKKIGTAKL